MMSSGVTPWPYERDSALNLDEIKRDEVLIDVALTAAEKPFAQEKPLFH